MGGTGWDLRPRLVGRVVRLAVGMLFVLAALLLPSWTFAYALRVAVVFAFLFLFYTFLGWGLSRGWLHLSPRLGGFLSNGVTGAVMLAGIPHGFIFGHGEGFIGAALYVGLSLLLASWRADAGCEVMTLPAVLLGRHNPLPCILFTPIDALEHRCMEPADGRNREDPVK